MEPDWSAPGHCGRRRSSRGVYRDDPSGAVGTETALVSSGSASQAGQSRLPAPPRFAQTGWLRVITLSFARRARSVPGRVTSPQKVDAMGDVVQADFPQKNSPSGAFRGKARHERLPAAVAPQRFGMLPIYRITNWRSPVQSLLQIVRSFPLRRATH